MFWKREKFGEKTPVGNINDKENNEQEMANVLAAHFASVSSTPSYPLPSFLIK